MSRSLAGVVHPGSNELEIRVVAAARSGHHAVINWILQQIGGHRVFLNSCAPDRNPFTCCQKRHSVVYVDEFLAREGSLLRLFWSLQSAGRFSNKACLAYNYENLPIEAVRTEVFERNREKWLGKSRRRVDLLVLRDPYNLFASKFRWHEQYVHEPWEADRTAEEVSMWKDHAREYLRSRMEDSESVLGVSFNRWFSDRDYRISIAGRLGLTFSDRGLGTVGVWGYGSSFDFMDFDGQAQHMSVLGRWRSYQRHRQFSEIFRDRELVELSESVFGRIPGTEAIGR